MNWQALTSLEQLDQIVSQSAETPVIIFKHSTRCSISAMAKDRLERKWQLPESTVIPYYLDLITYREVSNAIAEKFHIAHESPQVLLIRNGECVYEESHGEISASEIEALLAA